MEWRVVKWGKRKNMLKWAKGSGTQERINQRQVWSTSFWQVCMQPACTACSLHAELSKLSSSLDWFWWGFLMHHNLPSSSGWFCITFLTALHASCMHCMQTCQDCVCCLKSKSLSDMCLPDPYPMQGFLWKGGSTYYIWVMYRIRMVQPRKGAGKKVLKGLGLVIMTSSRKMYPPKKTQRICQKKNSSSGKLVCWQK